MAKRALIVYDGSCQLCTRAVSALRTRSGDNHFGFATCQSPKGSQRLEGIDDSPSHPDTLYLLEDQHYFTKSSALVKIAAEIPTLKIFAKIMEQIPLKIRDWCYDRVAANRHRWPYPSGRSCGDP